MNKTEYNTITKLLDEGKIDELKQYLDKQMDTIYLKSARKVLMNLINSDCETEYPSHYQRVELHQGIRKTYRGIFTRNENGLILLYRDSNLFELYNEEILTPSMKDILERTCSFEQETKKQKLEGIKRVIADLDKTVQREVAYISHDEKCIEAWSSNEKVSVIVPSEYYTIAHQLLGEKVEEYMDNEGTGICLKSSNGRALIMGCK